MINGVPAPMARSTPISFVRSITPIDNAPVKAMPPTTAMMIARPNNIVVTVLN